MEQVISSDNGAGGFYCQERRFGSSIKSDQNLSCDTPMTGIINMLFLLFFDIRQNSFGISLCALNIQREREISWYGVNCTFVVSRHTLQLLYEKLQLEDFRKDVPFLC